MDINDNLIHIKLDIVNVIIVVGKTLNWLKKRIYNVYELYNVC